MILIRKQNTPMTEMMKFNCRLLFKMGRHEDEHYHGVFELSPEFWKRFVAEDKLFVDFSSCKVKDYLDV